MSDSQQLRNSDIYNNLGGTEHGLKNSELDSSIGTFVSTQGPETQRARNKTDLADIEEIDSNKWREREDSHSPRD